jgi:hypothetical protein
MTDTPTDKDTQLEHHHKFVIPVEWATNSHDMGYGIWKRVTKLRCECGEEIER